MQPSPMQKSSRTTLHYVIQNKSACDLVLTPLKAKYSTWQLLQRTLNKYHHYPNEQEHSSLLHAT